MPDKKKPIDPYAPQKHYAQNLKDTGYVRVTLWVPEDQREHILDYGRGLREEAR